MKEKCERCSSQINSFIGIDLKFSMAVVYVLELCKLLFIMKCKLCHHYHNYNCDYQSGFKPPIYSLGEVHVAQ